MKNDMNPDERRQLEEALAQNAELRKELECVCPQCTPHNREGAQIYTAIARKCPSALRELSCFLTGKRTSLPGWIEEILRKDYRQEKIPGIGEIE